MKYEVVVRTHCLEGNTYTAYGIRCAEALIEDISLCRQAVEGLAKLLNFHQVSPVHFHDVIEDFLAE